jgi:hypothetical protein
MSRNQAAYCLLQKDRPRVRLINGLARAFVIVVVTCVTLSALGQMHEIKAASEAANIISVKDTTWLLAFALVVANATLIVIAKAYQCNTRESQITAVETAKAMQRMADSIDKLATSVTIHDERAIKFIDRQNSYGDHHSQ